MILKYILGLLKLEFLPYELVASYHDIKKESLKTYIYKKYEGKNLRFKIIDGKLLVNIDYKYPLASKLDELRQTALIIAKNEHNLAKELAKITGKKQNTILRYFIRYTFKRVANASEMITALEKYIANNSLFGKDIALWLISSHYTTKQI